MKKLFVIPALFLVLCLNLSAASRVEEWKKVETAINQGLPRTAITNLDLIVTAALKEKAYGEATRAIARRIVLEGNIQGNKPEEKITRMEAEISKAPKEMVPLLNTILANWYWHYFQNNRWRFLQRTATAQEPGKDFTTWDLPRLFVEIDRQFGKALASPDALKKMPVAMFDEVLLKGTLPDVYRPTLYDFVSHDALKFYTSAEQAAAKAEDAFEIGADSPILGSVDNFLAWKPGTTDTGSPQFKAIGLYQDLLRFHQRDADLTAFLDADLARLIWAHNVAFGENKAARFKAALQAFADRWADHELSAIALHEWGRMVQGEGGLVAARRLAQRGVTAHPNTVGGRMCHNLVAEIEARSAAITTERIWNKPLPKIAVHYRNVTNVWFRAVAWDWNAFLDKRHSRPEQLNDEERKQLLAKAPLLEWSAALPATLDYQERVESLPAPDSLKPGFYFLIASHDRNFTGSDNQVTYTDIFVSELALVMRPFNGSLDGFVLEANSGEPIQGAEIMAWYLDNNGDRVANGPGVNSDENGFFTMAAQQGRGSIIRVRAKVGGVPQELGSLQDYYSYRPPPLEPNAQTIFFTDRAIYRPGQTIQYKGICLQVDPEKDNYQVLAGRRVTVVFSDPNGKEIAKAEHQANAYGSFSGSFTAPRDRLMGRMNLLVSEGPGGSTQFNVEEYKRPKFQATLEAPKLAAKLNDQVELIGKAESYTGAAIDGAPVKWRVVREVRWPAWWGWSAWRAPRGQGSQEIAHGTGRTETDGTFKIAFVAKPDPAVTEADEASFTFSIHADVTDTTGETRSADRGITVGFTALQALLRAEEWQTDEQAVALNIRTSTLDGEAQAAEGLVKIHRLREPAGVQRLSMLDRNGRGDVEGEARADTESSDPNHWELADVVVEKGFTTDAEGNAKLEFPLGAGVYRVMLSTQDRFGKKVTARLPLQVLRPADTKFAVKIPQLLAAPKWSLEPGEEFMAVWGTGYETGRAFIEIEHRNQLVERYWTKAGQTQQAIKRAITEAVRGGFTLHVTQVRENRAYLVSRHVDVPWSNKNLELKWDHFTSKLGPSQKETWTLEIQGPKTAKQNAERAVAEMVATLYDSSLDQFMGHYWQQRFGFFRNDYSQRGGDFANVAKGFQYLQGQWSQDYRSIDRRYRAFPADLVANIWGYRFPRAPQMARGGVGGPMEEGVFDAAAAPAMMGAATNLNFSMDNGSASGVKTKEAKEMDGDRRENGRGGSAAPGPDLSQVTARKNLNETAFFFPQLISDKQGVIKLQFTMPEALTQWRFMGFAHDAACRSGFLEGKTVTAKDLMVQPNPPRFLREGDTLEFTVKVSNQTAARQEGRVRLTLQAAATGDSMDRLLQGIPGSEGTPGEPAIAGTTRTSTSTELAFDIPAKESRSYSWRIRVPDGTPFLTYKAVGSTGKVSDGEEGYLPVLSRRIFVTESLPLPIRGKAGGPVTRKFEFTKLLKSGQSSSLVHQNLTVQMVSNPSWYAVMALPYLMEFPHECTEQTFNRLYANALARTIAISDPKIRRVFDQWKGTPALDSPLEKNQDLKSVMVEETPWLRQANSESEARRNVGVLFDANRLDSETAGTLRKLVEMQLPDGAWPWFPGGRGNDYITLYITTGFGRLRHLGTDLDVTAAIKSLNRLDGWMEEHYREILKMPRPDQYVPSATDALYLYGRSFFLKDQPVAKPHQDAVNFFLTRAREHWLKVDNRQSQGHLALALHRFGNADNRAMAKAIMKSIKERSVSSEEMGMFWRETELSWWWYRAPIETQALMIEAFDEVMGDKVAVEDCRVWLLKQKQTQDWKTTKATADAVYALLLRGRDLLASDALVEVTLSGVDVRALKSTLRNPQSSIRNQPEAGTGFYERKLAGADIKPKFGEITVKKMDEGVAWGSVHWQYLEDMGKVTPYQGTPLKLKKSLYTRVNTKKGPVLEAVKGPVSVGDELVVRIELRVDRDMEYIHLKDQRGSGTEPVNVISRYKYQDGLGYYESTRDTASHFFIDYLPKGVYVFEYSVRVQHRGQYQTGLADIQCMYAPEFNSHSESLPLVVK